MARKASNPLDAIAFDEIFTAALASHDELVPKTQAVNDAIRRVNAHSITAKKAETRAADVKAAEAVLNRYKLTRIRHTAAVANLCADHARLIAEKTSSTIGERRFGHN